MQNTKLPVAHANSYQKQLFKIINNIHVLDYYMCIILYTALYIEVENKNIN